MKSNIVFIIPLSIIIIVSLALSLVASSTCQKGQIKGKIVSLRNCYMSTMKNVKVTIKGKKTGLKDNWYTDSNGYFSFNGLKEDTYNIKTEKKGFKSAKEKIKLKQGAARNIEIEIDEK